MHLKNIDKSRLKQRQNRFTIAMIVGLLVLSLIFSQLYIALWSTGGSNFWLNAAGVATAVFLLAGVINHIKHKPYMEEVVYVWRLKRELTQIASKQKRLDAALAKGEHSAYVVRYFQLHASKHLYELEDNTVTLDDLNRQIREFDQLLAQQGLQLSLEDYHTDLLEKL